MNLFEAIQVAALWEVANARRPKPKTVGDSGYALRRIFREYSKLFHVPLTEVENLPIEDVLRDYYEEKFESLGQEDLEAAVQDALVTPDELRERQMAEDEQEFYSVQDKLDIIAEEVEHAAKIALKKLADIKAGIAPAPNPMQVARMSAEPTLIPTTRTAPDVEAIKMEFQDPDDFDFDADTIGGGFGILDKP